MARVSLDVKDSVIAAHRAVFDRIAARGPLLNVYRALAHSPAALHHFTRLAYFFLDDGKLDASLRELSILRVAWLCRSRYVFAQHVRVGRKAGLSDEKLRGIVAASPPEALFSASERAVLAFADEVTNAARAAEATFAAATASLDAERVVELTLVTAFAGFVARAMNTLEVDLDDSAAADLAGLGIVIG